MWKNFFIVVKYVPVLLNVSTRQIITVGELKKNVINIPNVLSLMHACLECCIIIIINYIILVVILFYYFFILLFCSFF